MAEIARRAGIGKSTIYEYFVSKDELLQQACAQVWDSILEELGGNLTLLLTNDPIKDTLYECVEEFQQILFRRIGQAVKDGISAGELSPRLDVTAATVMLTTMPSPILLSSMKRAGVERPMDRILEMLMAGLALRPEEQT